MLQGESKLLMYSLQLATWNLCLGLANKKDTVIDTLQQNEIEYVAFKKLK